MKHFIITGLTGMLLLTFCATVAFSALLDDNVVLYLPLDEGKGQVAKDQSKFGNDGEIRNAKWVEGKYGSALEFICCPCAHILHLQQKYCMSTRATTWQRC